MRARPLKRAALPPRLIFLVTRDAMTTEKKFNADTVYEAAFNQPEYHGDRIYYIIFYVPRSGSWLLCDLLQASGVMGVPAEYFNMQFGTPEMAKSLAVSETDAIPFPEYVTALKRYRTTPNGVFGFKVEPKDLNSVIKSRALQTEFAGAKFIFMSRKDLVAQGVSYDLATQTQQWHASPTSQSAEFDEARVRRSIDFIASLVTAWEDFFEKYSIEPYRVEYETLLEEPHRVCSEICQFLGVETDHVFSIESSGLKKQGNTVNEDWIRRINEQSG
jgi:trehalose 2-sulfotransferase